MNFLRESHEPSTREIPYDVVVDILTRLPAKSLMRFKSVSKLWSSLIRSQYFTKRYTKVSSSSSPLRHYMRFGIYTSHDRVALLSSHFLLDLDSTIPAMEGYSPSHVFRGLMCFTNEKNAKIYNTSTRQLVVLPDIVESNIIMSRDDEYKNITYHIGHDPVHDQYKVVYTASSYDYDEDGEFIRLLSEEWVLLLGGGDGSKWRKIPRKCPPHRTLTQGFNLNGSMHYLALVDADSLVLVTLDIHSEEINMLEVPEYDDDDFHLRLCLIEYRGRVAFLHYPHLQKEGKMDLYVLGKEEEEDAEKKKKKSLSMKTLVLHPSQKHIVYNFMGRLKIKGTTRDGEVIMVPDTLCNRDGYLYNIQKNHMRSVEITARPNDLKPVSLGGYWTS